MLITALLTIGKTQKQAVSISKEMCKECGLSIQGTTIQPWEKRKPAICYDMDRPCCAAYLLSRVRFFVTPWSVARQAPLTMEILQERILEWVAMPSSRGSSWPRSPALQSDSLPSEPPGKPMNTGVGSLSLLLESTQESNRDLLHSLPAELPEKPRWTLRAS